MARTSKLPSTTRTPKVAVTYKIPASAKRDQRRLAAEMGVTASEALATAVREALPRHGLTPSDEAGETTTT